MTRNEIAGLVDRCSDAVLRLEDGDIPCSKFAMMAACSVLRAMIADDDANLLSDPGAVIPVADRGVRKYENFCDVVHGVRRLESMRFEDLIDVHECASRLGAPDIERSALIAAWQKAPSIGAVATAGVLPELMYLDDGIAREIAVEMCCEFPLWVDLQREVLDAVLKPCVTDVIIRRLLPLQHHYPPSAVAKWALPWVRTESLAFTIATANMHLYGPHETRPVFGELIKLYHTNLGWNQQIPRLLHEIMQSTAWHNHVPLNPGGVTGTHVEFEDLPRTLVFVSLPPNRVHSRKKIALTPSLRVQFPKKDRPFCFDVHAGHIQKSRFQIHVTVSRRLSFLDPVFEAWYEFDDAAMDDWTPAPRPAVVHGAEDVDSEMSKVRGGMVVRFDVRYGPEDALIAPL